MDFCVCVCVPFLKKQLNVSRCFHRMRKKQNWFNTFTQTKNHNNASIYWLFPALCVCISHPSAIVVPDAQKGLLTCFFSLYLSPCLPLSIHSFVHFLDFFFMPSISSCSVVSCGLKEKRIIFFLLFGLNTVPMWLKANFLSYLLCGSTVRVNLNSVLCSLFLQYSMSTVGV